MTIKSENINSTEQSFKALKWLCVLSLLGFVYCISNDTSHWAFFNHSNELKNNQEAYESMQDLKENWLEKGLDFNDSIKNKLATFYLIRAIIDVLALLGVALMNFKLKIGFVIYSVFQFSYVLSSYFFLKEYAAVVVPVSTAVIHVIYVVLFYTQYN